MNFPDRVSLATRVEVGKNPLGAPIYEDRDVVTAARVEVISGKEANTFWTVTDVSVRVPASYALLPANGRITALSGPFAGRVFEVTSVRPNRDHTRYIVRGIEA